MEKITVHITGVGTALPGEPVGNADLAEQLGLGAAGEQWIDTFIGTRTRHFAFDLRDGMLRRTLAELGAEAGAQAMAKAGRDASQIDLVVMGTASPDRLMPATVNEVADRLGIDDVASYQLQSGCSGAVQALDVAHRMLVAGAGRTALVLGGDTCVKHYDPHLNARAVDPAQLVNVLLFGDGMGAAVLTRDPAPGSPELIRVRVRLRGLGREPGQVVEWAGGPVRDSARPGVVEDYRAIEESVPVLAAEAYAELLADLDWKPDDTDYLLPPQLSGRMTDRIVDALDAPNAQEISCVREIGNTGNALPFFQLERLLPRMVEGDRAVALAVESSKWIKAAFALEMT